MSACFCIGPRPGHSLCPCRERDEGRRETDAFMLGFEAGRKAANRATSGLAVPSRRSPRPCDTGG
jgi:hypothetical protein